MKDEATPEQSAMARLIYANYGAAKANEAGDVADTAWMDAVLAGDADKTHGVQIALAAIIETQRLDAAVAERVINKMRGSGESDLRTARHLVCAAIRAGQHYGKDTDQ